MGKPGDPSPPIFERIFKNARFAQGGNAIFEGCVRGNPRPSVSWTHKGVPLLESRKIRMSYNENSGTVTLQINQIGPGDEGEYTCSAKNQYGRGFFCKSNFHLEYILEHIFFKYHILLLVFCSSLRTLK